MKDYIMTETEKNSLLKDLQMEHLKSQPKCRNDECEEFATYTVRVGVATSQLCNKHALKQTEVTIRNGFYIELLPIKKPKTTEESLK